MMLMQFFEEVFDDGEDIFKEVFDDAEDIFEEVLHLLFRVLLKHE